MSIIKIIRDELQTERLKKQEEIQRLVNNDKVTIDSRVVMIKSELREIAILSVMLDTWAGYTGENQTSVDTQNKEQTKPKEDGTV
tara:strand:+ start:96298 stop:96552 length:255 start_codon:yes stop_codon:yes gene_type:complete